MMIEICEIMKKWAQDDKNYPAKLWDEIISGNVQRGKIMQNIKKQVQRGKIMQNIKKQVTRGKIMHDIKNR